MALNDIALCSRALIRLGVQPISSSSFVDEDDVKNTKSILRDFGLYPKDRGIEGFTDNELFDEIKDFQKIAGLTVDGIIRPQGETEESVNHILFAIKDIPKPPRKPEIENKFQPPVPKEKPDVPENDKEEALERLEERLKVQKKLYDALKKGRIKGGLPFLYELQK